MLLESAGPADALVDVPARVPRPPPAGPPREIA
jgi:hypothetical protein